MAMVDWMTSKTPYAEHVGPVILGAQLRAWKEELEARRRELHPEREYTRMHKEYRSGGGFGLFFNNSHSDRDPTSAEQRAGIYFIGATMFIVGLFIALGPSRNSSSLEGILVGSFVMGASIIFTHYALKTIVDADIKQKQSTEPNSSSGK